MLKTTKILGAVAVAGLVAIGGSAYTAAGLTNTADTDQFFGGTVSQTISGAVLSSVDYSFDADESQTSVDAIVLTFDAAATGHGVTVTPAGTGVGTFSCEDVGETVPTPLVSTCTYVPANGKTGFAGMTGIDITVAA